ncbi:unnamed protein product [Blepharisma stoltei]|uniref:Uncharacterized protein n=1 Tax=Blepharisma stoltei TaxID=1481888 RepID=A0AAU9J3S3_9CILI|nr:unnamed protein product [Blepharisma stoltei]
MVIFRNMSILTKTSLSLCAICASTIALFEYSHDYITNLLVRSTRTSLREPELRDDVYILMRRLLTRLLNDSTTREKASEFFKAALHSEKLENSTLDVTLKNMQTIEYQSEALNLMVAISDHVLRDETLKMKTKNLSSTYKEAAAYMQNVKKIKIGRKSQDILKADFEMPKVNFNEMVKEYYQDYYAEQLKELIRKQMSQHIFNIPKHDIPRPKEAKTVPMLGAVTGFQAITNQLGVALSLPIEPALEAIKYDKYEILRIKQEETKNLEIGQTFDKTKEIQFDLQPEISIPQKTEQLKFEESIPAIPFSAEKVIPIDQDTKKFEEQFVAEEEVKNHDFEVEKLKNDEVNIDDFLEKTKNLIKSASSLVFEAEARPETEVLSKEVSIPFIKKESLKIKNLKIEGLIQKLKLESLDWGNAKVDESFHVELQSPENAQDQESFVREPLNIDSLKLESVQIEEPFHVDLLGPERNESQEISAKNSMDLESLNLEKANIDESFHIDLMSPESIGEKEVSAAPLSADANNLAFESLESALEFHKKEILQNSEGHILEAMKELTDEIESFGSPMKFESIEKDLLLERIESQHIKY